jgi:hypothetical protein
MGYVNDVSLTFNVPLGSIILNGGTWSIQFDDPGVFYLRAAEADDIDIYIPISLQGSQNMNQGARIKSLDIWYKISTAVMASFDVPERIMKVTLPSTGSETSYASIAVTPDSAHDTEAELKAVGSHKLTITPSEPFYLEDNYAYWFRLSLEGSATGQLYFISSQINYELRL